MSNSSGNNTQELPRHDFAASVYNLFPHSAGDAHSHSTLWNEQASRRGRASPCGRAGAGALDPATEQGGGARRRYPCLCKNFCHLSAPAITPRPSVARPTRGKLRNTLIERFHLLLRSPACCARFRRQCTVRDPPPRGNFVVSLFVAWNRTENLSSCIPPTYSTQQLRRNKPSVVNPLIPACRSIVFVDAVGA